MPGRRSSPTRRPRERLERAAAALTAHGFTVEILDDAAAARARIQDLIPAGASVFTGASETLRLSGIDADINASGRYDAIRPRVLAMDRATEADDIRRLLASPDVAVGSVHAVTETGSLVIASGSGSQLPGYAGGAARAIWIVGAQKIVPDLEHRAAPRRGALPAAGKRPHPAAYGSPSAINRLLVLNAEPHPGAAPCCCSARRSGSEPAGPGPARIWQAGGTMTISISALELVASGSWQPPELGRLGEWQLRAAEGFTGRANSALAVGDPGVPLEQAIDLVTAWYTARGLPPTLAVPYLLGDPGGSELNRLLDARGWSTRSGPAVVMTAEPGAVPAPNGAGTGRVLIAAEPDDRWMSLYHYRGMDLPPIARTMLLSAPWQAFGLGPRGRPDDRGGPGGGGGRLGRVHRGRGQPGSPAAGPGHPAHLGAGRARRRPGPGRLLAAGRGAQHRCPRAVPAHRVHRPPRLPLPDRPAALTRAASATSTACPCASIRRRWEWHTNAPSAWICSCTRRSGSR